MTSLLLRTSISLLCLIVNGEATEPDGAALYQTNCAQCHGAELQGGNAQSLVDGIWQFGGQSWAVSRTITQGITHLGMPAFGLALAQGEISAIMAFLKEQESSHDPQPRPLPQTLQSQEYDIAVDLVTDDLESPWSIDFIDESTALITERPGRLRVVRDGLLLADAVVGIPTVEHDWQGGLLDVVVGPDYATDGWIYLSYSHQLDDLRPGDERPASMTRIIRGRIIDNGWRDQQTLFEAPHESYATTRHHYGSRIALDREGYLYFSIGDRGKRVQAQDLSRPNGKVHRLHLDGRIPNDNPFIERPSALPSIFSFGHRNPQGLAIHPETDRLWDSEHGPMGGDEVNVIRSGGNYGWPDVSYGRNYDSSSITELEHTPDTQQPAWIYRPSTGVCGLDVYRGDMFPRWQGHLLVGALKFESVEVLTLDGDHVIHTETVVKNLGRVRDVAVAPDGSVYVVLNDPGRVIALTAIRDRIMALQPSRADSSQ